jgi:hypothetical protein
MSCKLYPTFSNKQEIILRVINKVCFEINADKLKYTFISSKLLIAKSAILQKYGNIIMKISYCCLKCDASIRSTGK